MVLYTNIIKILNWFEFKEITHAVSHSCDESKQFRAEQWLEWIWSKNIVFHCKWNFYLVTTTWEKDIKARNFKKEFWSKDIRFASQDEITATIWAKIWSIPPFWFDNENIPIFVDKEIFEHQYFIFNPWDPEKSIQIKTSDLSKIYSSMKNPIKYFTHKEDDFQIFDWL